MSIETIFFDRDGVINDIVLRGNNSISSPRNLTEFCIRPDFISLYKNLPKTLNLFVVSNQPDVARQLLSDNILKQMNTQLESAFSFKEIVYCVHDDVDNCHCRKPKPGMITDLLTRYQLPTDTAIIVGDSEKDILAGHAANIKTVYFKQAHNSVPSCNPHFTINQIADILDILKCVEVEQ